MSRRKSDKNKINEGYGTGRSKNYNPYIHVHDFGTISRTHRIKGWKTGRVHHLLSDLELYFFLLIQWSNNYIDIREQFPLLPLEDTIQIAKDLGIKHPAENNKLGDEFVMTSDFVITIKEDNMVKDIVRTIKPKDKLTKRTVDKFMIEKEYFSRKGINDWGIITEDQINIVKARNISFLYSSYFWDKRYDLTRYELDKLTNEFLNMLIKNNYVVLETTEEFTELNNWRKGEGLVFFKYLLAHQILKTDLDTFLTFEDIEVWIEEEDKRC